MALDYLILGAGGQLGQAFTRRLGQRCLPLTHEEADLTIAESLEAQLLNLRPRVVLNCAAYNLVDHAEADSLQALQVNAWGVAALARLCADLDCTLVHFSTDYVFGGDRNRNTPYSEEDIPGPLSVYGTSKLAGEWAVRDTTPRHFVLRTCGLYGPLGQGGKGDNFVETMLQLAGAGHSLRVVNDQICCPTYTSDLVDTALELTNTERYGLYHVVNSGACSWYDFARMIFELKGLTTELEAASSAELQRPAPRPHYSVLECRRLVEQGFAPPRPIEQALASHLGERGASAPGLPVE